MRCSSTTRVLVPRRALILGFPGLPGNQQPEILLAGGTPSQVSRLASLRRVVPGRLGSDLAVGSGAWRLFAGVASVRSHGCGDLLPALAGVHLGPNDLGLTADRSGRSRW